MDLPRPAAAGKSLQWSGRTDPGKVRPNNEDAFVGLRFDAREVHYLGACGKAPTTHFDFVFAVSDGMGGALAGEHASRMALQAITRLLPRAYRQSAVGLEAGFADVLEELFDRVHRELVLLGESYAECLGMEATLSLCWFTPGKMYFGHVGDSRIYYRPAASGIVKQLSQDDTHVGWLLRNGMINERQARGHPRRNLLQKALGGGNQFVTPQAGSVAYELGDIFLLCTDGLVEGLYDSHLGELLSAPGVTRMPPNVAALLVEESLARDGRDNTTALVIQVV